MIPGPIYKIHVVIWWSRARSDRHPPKAWHPRTDISWPHAQSDWHSPVRWRRGKALLTSSWQTRNTCPKLIVHQNHQRFPSQNWNPTIYVYTVYIILFFQLTFIIDNRVSKTCWIRGCLTSQGFLLLDRVKTPGVGWVPDLHPPLCDEALEVVYVLSVNWSDFSWPNWPIWFQCWQMLADVGHHRILTQVRLTISKG